MNTQTFKKQEADSDGHSEQPKEIALNELQTKIQTILIKEGYVEESHVKECF